MTDPIYLTTEEAGDYLRVRERKIYELAAAGAIPCSKVTGKWLFPRAALDRWVAAGMARPPGFAEAAPPMIVGGSTDPLLEWAMHQSGSGLASLPEGSEAGLSRLVRNEVAIAAIHLHRADTGGEGDANLDAVRSMAGLHDAVAIAFVRREQGLATAPGNPLGLASVADAVDRGARAVLRQTGAGAQLLLLRILAEAGIEPSRLAGAGAVAATGQDLAQAIRAGTGDWGIVTRAVADAYGLGFVPLTWEVFDLVLRRRSYFEPGIQGFMRFVGSGEFRDRAAALGGYDTSASGDVRLNA